MLRAEQAELRLADAERAEIERAKALRLAGRAETAREIHDILAHNLGALVVQLDVVNALLEGDHPNLDGIRPVLRDAHRHAVDGLAEAREAVSSLREDSKPLAASLRQLVDSVPGASLEVDGARRDPPADVSLVVRRIAQEALTNAMKHAPGAESTVRIEFRPASILLTVADSGRPDAVAPAPLAATGGGYGIEGMRERAQQHRGRPQSRPGGAGLEGGAERPGPGARLMTESSPIRVVVADDQRAIREALAMMLDNEADISVVGTAADGAEAIGLAGGNGADVVLMDLRMPGTDGVTATRQLRESDPDVKVVVLTTFADDVSIQDALLAGAVGYLTKDAGHRQIILAVRSAAAGQTVLDPAVHSALLRNTVQGRAAAAEQPSGEVADGLTRREVDVLRGIAQGRSNAEIAGELYISEVTVKSHINHLFAKIQVRNRAEAVRYAYDHGLADRPD